MTIANTQKRTTDRKLKHNIYIEKENRLGTSPSKQTLNLDIQLLVSVDDKLHIESDTEPYTRAQGTFEQHKFQKELKIERSFDD